MPAPSPVKPHHYDIAKIQCPCFLYHDGNETGPHDGREVPLRQGRRNHELIPGSEFIAMPEHGHASLIMEFERTAVAGVQGKSVQSRFKNTNPFTPSPTA